MLTARSVDRRQSCEHLILVARQNASKWRSPLFHAAYLACHSQDGVEKAYQYLSLIYGRHFYDIERHRLIRVHASAQQCIKV